MSYRLKQSLKEGYEKFVIKNSDGCWDWKGCCAKNPGYGQFRSEGKIFRAHRASWMIYRGEIPSGMFVCHKCDNKRCSNPDHLFLGTCKDNNLDAINKKILPFGQIGIENHRSKLTEDEVNEIRILLKYRISQSRLAKIFNVSQTLISAIKQDKLWRKLCRKLA